MKTVVIEGKDLLFTLFKLAFYIWIGMWNVRILLVAVKMVIAVGVYSTYFAVILVSVYGIYSAFRGLKKTVAKTIALMDDYFKETGDAMEDYSFRVGFGYDIEEGKEYYNTVANHIYGESHVDQVGICQIGATIAVHTGPYAIGIGCVKKYENYL